MVLEELFALRLPPPPAIDAAAASAAAAAAAAAISEDTATLAAARLAPPSVSDIRTGLRIWIVCTTGAGAPGREEERGRERTGTAAPPRSRTAKAAEVTGVDEEEGAERDDKTAPFDPPPCIWTERGRCGRVLVVVCGVVVKAPRGGRATTAAGEGAHSTVFLVVLLSPSKNGVKSADSADIFDDL